MMDVWQPCSIFDDLNKQGPMKPIMNHLQLEIIIIIDYYNWIIDYYCWLLLIIIDYWLLLIIDYYN